MIRINKIFSTPQLALREMEVKDIPEVSELFSKYMARFGMAPVMTKEEVEHMFLSGRGRGEIESALGRREGQVVWSYVVEVRPFTSILSCKLKGSPPRQEPFTHRITDFFSFYSLPSTIINNPKHNLLEAAYLFYYATDIAFQEGVNDDNDVRLKNRLLDLVGDALIVADQAKFDVFNALTLMDNVAVLEDLKVGGQFLVIEC